MRMLTEIFPEFTKMFDQMDDLLTEKRPVDEKPTSSSALPCPSRVDQSPVCSNISRAPLMPRPQWRS